MGRLLIVHHTPSPAMQAMFESVVAGAGTDEIDGVEVVIRPALTAAAAAAGAALRLGREVAMATCRLEQRRPRRPSPRPGANSLEL